MTHLGQIALVVKDYDEAIAYYTQVLGFQLLEDVLLKPEKRWVVIGKNNLEGCKILLAKATSDARYSRVGNQTGGRVFLFFYTDDFLKDYETLKNNGVNFIEMPRTETYGRVAVFKDLYGNLWDLVEKK